MTYEEIAKELEAFAAVCKKGQAAQKKEKAKATKKALTYEELMQFAKEHYNDGGDATYECWGRAEYDSYVEMFGQITKKDALEMFRLDKAIYEDRSTAW